jgi:iron(III) transport system permease protein
MMKRYSLPELIFLSLCGVFFLAFLFYPLGYVFQGAFSSQGRVSLVFFRILVQNPVLRESVINSLNLAGIVTLLCFVISLPLAFSLFRYRFSGRGFLQSLLILPMIMPPFVGAIGMRHLFARFGSVNLILMRLGLISEPWDWFGQGFLGVVILEVLHLYPIMVLNLMAALSHLDPSLEDTAASLGASPGRVFRTVTLPLLKPGAFAGMSLVFIWSFTDLGTPLMFEYRKVVPIQIFDMVTDIRVNPMGHALVVLVMVLTAVFFFAAKSILASDAGGSYGPGPGSQPERRPARAILVAIWCGSLILAGLAVLPHLSVILVSTSSRWFMTIVPELFTRSHLVEIFHHPLTTTGIKNSLLLSALAAGGDLFLGFAIAYFVLRGRFRGRGILDTIAMLPLAIPGIVLAFGYVAAFSDTPLNPRMNPLPLLAIAYGVRRLPFAVRAAYAGLSQVPRVLEEASANLGAGSIFTIRRITLPLISGNVAAALILCFAFAMLEVSDSLILAMQEQYYPITKVIYDLTSRLIEGANLASALGVLGMALLLASLLGGLFFSGRKLGEIFRIG